MNKLKAILALVIIIALCVWDGVDRYQTQKYVLRLERQVDGIMFASERAEYRKAHPLKGGSP